MKYCTHALCCCSLSLIASFVQYGYYFFLDKPVEARPYAQIGSSSQRVPLFLKRSDRLDKRERLYFPLTGISYLVMQVSRGCATDTSTSHPKGTGEGHLARLENILQMGDAMEMLCKMKGKRGLSMRSKKGNH